MASCTKEDDRNSATEYGSSKRVNDRSGLGLGTERVTPTTKPRRPLRPQQSKSFVLGRVPLACNLHVPIHPTNRGRSRVSRRCRLRFAVRGDPGSARCARDLQSSVGRCISFRSKSTRHSRTSPRFRRLPRTATSATAATEDHRGEID